MFLKPSILTGILAFLVLPSSNSHHSSKSISHYFTYNSILPHTNTHTHTHTHIGQITVVGPDAPSVQQAREMLELFTETFELKAHQIEYLSHDYSMLGELSLPCCNLHFTINLAEQHLNDFIFPPQFCFYFFSMHMDGAVT